jgi:hypothetical protein
MGRMFQRAKLLLGADDPSIVEHEANILRATANLDIARRGRGVASFLAVDRDLVEPACDLGHGGVLGRSAICPGPVCGPKYIVSAGMLWPAGQSWHDTATLMFRILANAGPSVSIPLITSLPVLGHR